MRNNDFPFSLNILCFFFLSFLSVLSAQAESKNGVQSYTENGLRYFPAPHIPYETLRLDGVESWRKSLIKEALKVRAASSWPRYIFGSADPSKGGFDCSGAMYYLLQKKGYNPPRTSANQYLWLREKGKLHHVSPEATHLKHPDFRHLKPGDLVFWSGTYVPTDGRSVPVTHVGMYIGHMNGYEKPLMICSSKGRSFNKVRCDGYGVFDFKLPSATSKSKIVGYGSIK